MTGTPKKYQLQKKCDLLSTWLGHNKASLVSSKVLKNISNKLDGGISDQAEIFQSHFYIKW